MVVPSDPFPVGEQKGLPRPPFAAWGGKLMVFDTALSVWSWDAACVRTCLGRNVEER